VVKDNTIQMANAVSAIGIFIAVMTNAITSLSVNRNKVQGSGVANNNNYGIQDANNNNGKSDVVKYVRNDISDITGSGSHNYQTLVTHAVVINAAGQTVGTTTSGATPSVQGLDTLILNYSGGVTITDLTNGYPSQTVQLIFVNGNATVQNNASILLAGAANFVGTANDTLTLKYSTIDGGSTYQWRQVSSSVN
jgi:hypothetical protein